jgi:LCP family protein required for cell wall assembly
MTRPEPGDQGSATGRRFGLLGRAGTIGGRIVAGLAAVVVLVTSGVAWSLDSTGTSNAVAAAGDVGVVDPAQQSAAGDTTIASQEPSASVGESGAPSSSAAPVPAIGAENILVVGADSRTDAQGNPLTAQQQAEIGAQLDGGGVNTDTLLIVHIPAGGGQATGVSIPRDTWMGPDVVNAPGVTGPDQDGNQVHYLPEKINSFYGTAKYYDQEYLQSKGITGAEQERESDEAGRTMLIKIVQQFTGIKINHYAEVNLLGFYLMSEAIGGVPVCLLHPEVDRQSGADFQAGYQTVEGKSALAFVRQRHGLAGGDLDRIKRQQAFLESAANKILTVGTLTNPARLSALFDAAQRSIVLDSGFDLLTFAEQMRTMVAGHLHFSTIPTTDDTGAPNTDALQADPREVRAIFAAMTANEPLPIPADNVAATTSTAVTPSVASSTLGGLRLTSAGATPTPSTGPAQSGGFQVPCVN